MSGLRGYLGEVPCYTDHDLTIKTALLCVFLPLFYTPSALRTFLFSLFSPPSTWTMVAEVARGITTVWRHGFLLRRKPRSPP
jgi:hypothetical protein